MLGGNYSQPLSQLLKGLIISMSQINFNILRFPESILAALISGRHDNVSWVTSPHDLSLAQVEKDKDGNIFLDRNGDIFYHVLSFLRDDQLPDGVISPGLLLALFREAEYLNIRRLAELLRCYGAVSHINILKERCSAMGAEYDSFRNDLILSACKLCEISPSFRMRPLLVHNVASATHCPCGAFPPEPELVFGKNVGKLTSPMADVFCPVPRLQDWKDILLEDLRLRGYNALVQARPEAVRCLGIAGPSLNFGEEPCRFGPDGEAAVVAFRVEVSFSPLAGPESRDAAALTGALG
jgi:hypothetical protein